MDHQLIDITRRWVDEVVLGLNLCPFVAPVLKADTLRITVCDSAQQAEQLQAVLRELELLHCSSQQSIATSLLVFNQGLEDFNRYLDFAAHANDVLAEAGLEGVIQLATFHPDYQFAGESPGDVSHYTNRAPFPLLHFIREDQLEQVLKSFPQPEKIPQNNVQLLRKTGLKNIKALFDGLLVSNSST